MVQVSNEDRVDIPCNAYKVMENKWKLLHDLLGGTEAMQKAGKQWLPMEPKEDIEAYKVRLNRSILYGAYEDTIEKLVSKPFSKPVTVKGTLPDRLNDYDNVDNEGRNLTQFSKELFYDALVHGVTHVYVDYPKVSRNIDRGEEKVNNINPYFIHIKAPDLIGWRYGRIDSGEKILTQIRRKETKIESKGNYGSEEVDYIRVYNIGSWQLFRKDLEDKEYALVAEGPTDYPGIPLVTYYMNRTGFMTADPPLERLAYLNLAHWQSYSDYKNILRFASVGILFASGFTEDEIKKGIYIGPKQLTGSTNPDAKLAYVEHSGKALGSAENHLKTLEDMMRTQGLQLLLDRAQRTATSIASDDSKTYSSILSDIRTLENMLMQCYKVKGKWINTEISDDFNIDIFSDFVLSLKSDSDVKALADMRTKKEITRSTYLNEMKRRGILSEGVDVETEIEEAEEDYNNALSLMTASLDTGTFEE